MDDVLEKLFVNRVLKLEQYYLKTKGLTHIPHMPHEFQVKCIRFIISRVHNGQLWLEQPILITKKMIHQITSLPMLAKAKMTKTLGWDELEKKTLAEWDGRGMKISSVTDMELKFVIHIIAHKIYSSSRLNNVS